MLNNQDIHSQTLDHLKEKFSLSEKEIYQIEEIKKHTIHSIFFTTEGGFDKKTGEFNSEEKENSYKIKIKLAKKKSKDFEWVYLRATKVDY